MLKKQVGFSVVLAFVFIFGNSAMADTEALIQKVAAAGYDHLINDPKLADVKDTWQAEKNKLVELLRGKNLDEKALAAFLARPNLKKELMAEGFKGGPSGQMAKFGSTLPVESPSAPKPDVTITGNSCEATKPFAKDFEIVCKGRELKSITVPGQSVAQNFGAGSITIGKIETNAFIDDKSRVYIEGGVVKGVTQVDMKFELNFKGGGSVTVEVKGDKDAVIGDAKIDAIEQRVDGESKTITKIKSVVTQTGNGNTFNMGDTSSSGPKKTSTDTGKGENGKTYNQSNTTIKGDNNTINGSNNKIVGDNNKINGSNNKIIGNNNKVNGSNNKAEGVGNKCTGSFNKGC